MVSSSSKMPNKIDTIIFPWYKTESTISCKLYCNVQIVNHSQIWKEYINRLYNIHILFKFLYDLRLYTNRFPTYCRTGLRKLNKQNSELKQISNCFNNLTIAARYLYFQRICSILWIYIHIYIHESEFYYSNYIY